MRLNNKRAVISIVAIVSTLTSCSIRLKGAKHGINNVMETYLVENNTVQFFIKPLHFSAKKTSLAVDLTFRGKKDSSFAGKVNMTLPDGYKMDSCHIVSGNNIISMPARNTEPVRMKNGYRYFLHTANATIYDQLNSGNTFSIVTYKDGATREFSPSKKTVRKLKKLPDLILSEQ